MRESTKATDGTLRYVHGCDNCGKKSEPWGYHMPGGWGALYQNCSLCEPQGHNVWDLCPECVEAAQAALKGRAK